MDILELLKKMKITYMEDERIHIIYGNKAINSDYLNGESYMIRLVESYIDEKIEEMEKEGNNEN